MTKIEMAPTSGIGTQFQKSSKVFRSSLTLTESNIDFLKKRMNEGQQGELNLSSSSLCEVPVKDFKRVQTLDLSSNRLVTLDGVFEAIYPRMDYLDLSHNQLKSLPQDIGEKLINLSHLDIHDNQMNHLPLSIAKMERLYWVDVRENPLFETLAFVCGSCKSDRKCRDCAVSLRHFMSTVAVELFNPLVKNVDAKRNRHYGSHKVPLLDELEVEAKGSGKIQLKKKEEAIMLDTLVSWLMGSKIVKGVLGSIVVGICIPGLFALIFDEQCIEQYISTWLNIMPNWIQIQLKTVRSYCPSYPPVGEYFLFCANLFGWGGNNFPLLKAEEIFVEPKTSWFAWLW